MVRFEDYLYAGIGCNGAKLYRSKDGLNWELVQDRPGVVADVTRALADQQISLSAITQRDPHDETCQQVVTVVVITHLAREGDLRAALRAIEQIPTVTRPPVAIRIVEEPQEF